jgi:DNA-directed RNA polymerase subunit RPC12/RpoP
MCNEYICRDCGRIFKDHEVLRGRNPFDSNAEITGCPRCKAIDRLVAACDYEGCQTPATCSWYDGDGKNRVTCSLHWKGSLF